MNILVLQTNARKLFAGLVRVYTHVFTFMDFITILMPLTQIYWELNVKNKCVNHIFRFHQALTMDVIISAAFGIEANPQENPDDPVAMAARNSMTRSTFERILLNVLSVMPFGAKIISMFPNLLMANSIPILKIAEEMVTTKRAGNTDLSRKVTLYSY